MGLGLIFDDLCVFFGVFIVWLTNGCKYSLWKELKTVKAGDLWRGRREGMIGLLTILAIGSVIWAIVHFSRKIPN